MKQVLYHFLLVEVVRLVVELLVEVLQSNAMSEQEICHFHPEERVRLVVLLLVDILFLLMSRV